MILMDKTLQWVTKIDQVVCLERFGKIKILFQVSWGDLGKWVDYKCKRHEIGASAFQILIEFRPILACKQGVTSYGIFIRCTRDGSHKHPATTVRQFAWFTKFPKGKSILWMSIAYQV